VTGGRDGRDGIRRLAAEVRALGGLIADAVPARLELPADLRQGPAQLAAAGPRVAGQRDAYELLVEAICEGYRLHYGEPLVVRDADPDLALLAGDRLYALGLDRLTELGDLPAVRELADVIALCAQAHAAGVPDLADAVWEAGAVAVGWGSSPEHELAKARAREGAPGAAEALRAAARRIRAEAAATG
jgi:hypothetical protein